MNTLPKREEINLVTTVDSTEPFPTGLLDEFFQHCGVFSHNHLLFNWALQFESHGKDLLTETHEISGLFSTLTTIDLSQNLSLTEAEFTSLTNLPLTNLTHLNLFRASKTTIPNLLEIISTTPVFKNLVYLNLSQLRLESIQPLVGINLKFIQPLVWKVDVEDSSKTQQLTQQTSVSDAKYHGFPHLTTLILNRNPSLDPLPLFSATAASFPNLNHLELEYNDLQAKVVQIAGAKIANSDEISPSFQLEKFSLNGNNRLGDIATIILLQSPFLKNVKELNLSSTGLSSKAIATVFDAEKGLFQPGQLTHLDLSYNSFAKERQIASLCTSPAVSNLVALNLSSTKITDVSIQALTQENSLLKSLKRLDLDGCQQIRLGPLLSSFPWFPEALNLRRAPMTYPEFQMLMELTALGRFKNLKRLDLGHISFPGQEWIDAVRHGVWPPNRDEDTKPFDSPMNIMLAMLSQSSIISNLTHLTVSWSSKSFDSGGEIGLDGLKTLLRSPLLSPNLTHLDISSHELDGECMDILTTTKVASGNDGEEDQFGLDSDLKFAKLEELYLDCCGLDSENASKLVQLINLKELSLFCNYQIDDGLIHALVRTQKDGPIDLDEMSSDSSNLSELSGDFTNEPSFSSMSSNLPDSTGLSWTHFLPALTNLEMLNLENCYKISSEGAIALSQSQLFNNLIDLSLAGSNVDEHGIDVLSKSKLTARLISLNLETIDFEFDPEINSKENGFFEFFDHCDVIFD